MHNQEQTPHDTIANMELPPVTETTTTTSAPEVAEEPVETAPEQPKETAKPQSKIDQELAKQKAKEQNKSKQQPTAPVQKPKPETVTKESTNSSPSEKPGKIIFEVGRKEEPKSKNPKNPTKFSIQKPTMIIRITTDHYNNSMGTPGGGIITIKDKLGNTVGSYKAFGKTGKNGTPSAKWVCEPHIILEKGSYMIMDSDMPTWSKTFLGTGFVVIEGYEVDQPE
jgi:outer membrane biosynthesis protein TonB